MGTWYYTWSSKKLKSSKDIPENPHYAIMVFTDHEYSSPGYDRDDPPSNHSVRTCDYYAFDDKAQWEKMISDIYTERQERPSQWGGSNKNEDIVFFHSSGRGKVDIKVNVSVNIK